VDEVGFCNVDCQSTTRDVAFRTSYHYGQGVSRRQHLAATLCVQDGAVDTAAVFGARGC
jgi:hypothetical protein